MASKLDKLLVVDVETTCWMGPPPEGMRNDIIEVGIAAIDIKRMEVDFSDSIIVLPTSSKISKFCKKLTSLTPRYVDENGVTFRKACEILKTKYQTTKRPWASWGDFDRQQFRRQCRREKVKYPFGKTHLNAKDLFSLEFRLDHELGMATALKHLNITLEGKHHRGVDDARNTATLLIHALWRNNGKEEKIQEGWVSAGPCNGCGSEIYLPPYE